MTGCQAELCASNVALPEHVRAGRTCSGKATLRTGRLAGWDTQHTSMSPPLLWRLGSCSASHTAVMVQAPARGLSAGLLLTHDAWHPHWTTLGPTPVKKDQEFARNRSAMVRLARGNAIGPSAERKPRIFHTVSKGSGDFLAEPVLTKMITGFGQKNALPKLGMAVPVMVHYRFGS